MLPPIIRAGIWSAAGNTRTRLICDEIWIGWVATKNIPMTMIIGVRERRRGYTRARKIRLTYLFMLIVVVLRIHNLSFSIHLIPFPDPKDPRINRINRNEIGDD